MDGLRQDLRFRAAHTGRQPRLRWGRRGDVRPRRQYCDLHADGSAAPPPAPGEGAGAARGARRVGSVLGSRHSHSASLAELSHSMFLEMRDKADVFAGVLRQHQPLHHPLAGAHEGGNQPGPPGVVIEPPLEDAGDFGRGSHQVRQLVQDKGERRPAVPPSDAAADRGVPQRAAPSWRTAFQWLLSVGSFDP